jgi:predicted  nucleic acid-binding Zn-ribbon protein
MAAMVYAASVEVEEQVARLAVAVEQLERAARRGPFAAPVQALRRLQAELEDVVGAYEALVAAMDEAVSRHHESTIDDARARVAGIRAAVATLAPA